MSKTLINMLITASFMLGQFGVGNGLSPNLTTAADREKIEQSMAEPAAVEVTFEGLMVLHREVGGNYEVGILPDPATHRFEIKVNKKKIDLDFPLDKSWILEVTKPAGGTSQTGTTLYEVGHSGRLKDSQTGQWDFSWAIDLEEFHGRPLTLIKGILKPIIHLPSGVLFTKYKLPMVERKQGKKVRRKQGEGEFSDFGFVAEATGLRFNLQADEELILRVNGTTLKKVLIPTAPGPGPGVYNVEIHNSPYDKPIPESHFTMYYRIFSDVGEKEQYDFRLKKNPQEAPYNEYPIEHKWIESYPCGLVVLGKRDEKTPLE